MDCRPPTGALRVALLSPGWPPESLANGIASYSGTIIAGLKELGVRCHVLASPPAQSTDPFVHVLPIQQRSLRSRIMWRLDPEGWPHRLLAEALLKEVRRLRASEGLDLLEMEESYGWPRLLAGKCPVPIVVRLHGPWFLNGRANGAAEDEAFIRRDNWEGLGLAAAGGITAPSQSVLEQTREHFRVALPDAQVIPNPVEPVTSANRWQLNACDRNRVVFIGRFDRHKGGDTMIDAFCEVLRQFPAARLDFVGPDRGYTDDAGRTWKFEEYLTAKLPDPERQKVTYHGFQPGPKAAELRKRALVTVAPSRYETFGIAAAEAMAAGCPLVVCDGGALTEVVQDGRNGLVARAGDAGDVGSKILVLLRNPQLAALLGEQAAADAAARYSPRTVARQTLEFYERVMQGRSATKVVAPARNERASMPV